MRNFTNVRGSVVASVSGHLLLVLFAQFGLPNVFTPPEVSVVIIPVELVTDDQLNAPPPPATPEPEPEPEAAAPPPPPQPPPAPPAEPEVVEAPPPPVEKPKPPEKKEPPKPPEKPKPEPSTLAKAKPQAKPKPPKPAKDFASVLKDLSRPDKTPTPAPKTRKTAPPKDQGEPTPAQPQIAERASITEIERLKQMIRRQIEPCWSPPVGAAEAEDLAVTIFIRVDQRGFVGEARVIDAPAMAFNTYVQAAAEAALRAVLNPRCQPFELPQNRYDLWKEIRFNFDPREMLG
jgi:outer membrane biosynthesis protein TonB